MTSGIRAIGITLTSKQLAALKDLYHWHKRQAEHCAKRYAECYQARSDDRFAYLKAQTLHVQAVGALEPLFRD